MNTKNMADSKADTSTGRLCTMCGRPATVHDITRDVWLCAPCAVWRMKRGPDSSVPWSTRQTEVTTNGGY